MMHRSGTILFTVLLLMAGAMPLAADGPAGAPPAQVMLLGLFHFDNPGLDAVRYEPIDVMQPEAQAYIAALAGRIAAFAPTRVLLEYREDSDARINGQYADYLAGRFALPRNEIYQLGFRVARLAGHTRVHGFDVPAPATEDPLWGYLSRVPATEKKLMDLIARESARLQEIHQTRALAEILALGNTAEEDRRNKGFYMLLNDVAADKGLFHGADAAANWWHRNLRMYALVQMHAQPGERVLVIAGSGHTAILRDLLRNDSERVEEDVLGYF